MSTVEKLAGVSPLVAYFSMEFCVSPNLPTYSGGLGVLAGDHLKAADDLGLPLLGVGIFYRHGYFKQKFNEEGWQQEEYPVVDPYTAGLEILVDEAGLPVTVTVPVEDRKVKTQAYLKKIGKVPLLLLTTDVEGNSEEDRMITAHLYGAVDDKDQQTRIRQEMVLGIGGKRMLDALRVRVGVFHMNEGHSAFLTLARVEELVEKGLSATEALLKIEKNQLFTNHTPVPAGNDVFPEEVLERELYPHLSLLGPESSTALKERANHLPDQPPGSWSQANFALSTSRYSTGVSRLHSEVLAVNWNRDKVDYVTNGVHHSWMDQEIKTLIDPDEQRFIRKHTNPDYLRWRMEQIDPPELRNLRNKKRRETIDFANTFLEHPSLDPDILLIGYARRAATYKRLSLPFYDPDRLHSILTNSERPVQIVLAAKAHPQDTLGKEMIQQLVKWTKDTKFRKHTLFIPDYDSRIAKYLVVGSDSWINVPQKRMEASGTSGMKSGMNGGRQFSVDDGWMNEIPDDLYFKIEDDADPAVVAGRIYQLMQEAIVPDFYASDGKPLSDRWIKEVMRSMAYIIPNFSASRMTGEYDSRFYQPLMNSVSLAI